MPKVVTRQHKDLLGTFVSDMVLQILSYVSENERVNIKQRQAEGINAAKIRGVQFGRPTKPMPEDFIAAFQRWKSGEISGLSAAKECGMAKTTFYRKAKVYQSYQNFEQI